MRSSHWLMVLLVSVLFLASPLSSSSQSSLVTNGDFGDDGDCLAGWDHIDNTGTGLCSSGNWHTEAPSLSQDDAIGTPGIGYYQCIDTSTLTGGFYAGAWIYVGSHEDGWISTVWYDDDACSSEEQDGPYAQTPGEDQTGEWIKVGKVYDFASLTVKNSVKIMLTTVDSASVYFDDVEAYEMDPTAVGTGRLGLRKDFLPSCILGGLAIAAIVCLRRQRPR